MREVFGDGRADDGLIQRFQFMVYPDIAPTWRNVDRPPDSDAKNRVFEIFKRLAVLDAEHLAAQQPEGDGVPFLRFTPEAQGILDAWRAALEKRLRGDSDEHPVVASHLAKYRSLMPSVALLFHLVTCVDRGIGGPVSVEATERALAWCSYLESHARRVYYSVTNGPATAAVALSRKIRGRKLPSPFRARTVVRQGWAGLTDPKEVYGALDILCELHWLRRQEIRGGDQGGRPTAEYHINPGVLSVSSVTPSRDMETAGNVCFVGFVS